MEKIKRIEKVGLIFTGLLGLIGAILKPSMLLGLVLGGTIMMANFHLLGKIVERILRADSTYSWRLIIAFLFKFAALFGSVALLVVVLKVNPVALSIGASTLVLAILYDAVLPEARVSGV